MRLTRLLPYCLALLIGCAGALAALGVVLQVADTARQWITRVDKQVRPYMEAIRDTPQLEAFLGLAQVAQKAAEKLDQCGRHAESERACDEDRKALQTALENLFAFSRPYGVQVEGDERLYGARPGNILGVPSPANIVGAQEDGSWSAPETAGERSAVP